MNVIRKSIGSPITIVLLGMVFWFLFWFMALMVIPGVSGIIMLLISYPIALAMFIAAQIICKYLANT